MLFFYLAIESQSALFTGAVQQKAEVGGDIDENENAAENDHAVNHDSVQVGFIGLEELRQRNDRIH